MKKCPLIQKKCIEHQCKFWTHLVGMNPQTGQPMDQWDCSLVWTPILLVENANMMRQATASIDRNNNTFVSALPDHVRQRIMMKQNVKQDQGKIDNGKVST